MTYTPFSGFGYRRALAGWWRVACLLVTLCLLQGAFPTSARATSLELRDDLLSIEAWPAVTVLPDPSGTLLVNDVIAEVARFQPPRQQRHPGRAGGTGVAAHPGHRAGDIQRLVGAGYRLPSAAAHRGVPGCKRPRHTAGHAGQPAALHPAPTAQSHARPAADHAAGARLRTAVARGNPGRDGVARHPEQTDHLAQQGLERADATRHSHGAGAVSADLQPGTVAQSARCAVHPVRTAHHGQPAVFAAPVWSGHAIPVARNAVGGSACRQSGRAHSHLRLLPLHQPGPGR